MCAPEPFARAPVEVRGEADPTAARMGYMAQLDDDLQIGDLEAAADYLVVHDDVREVAVMGFCMGGMQALKAAAIGSVRPGGGVLRDDPGAATTGSVRRPASRSTPRPRCARRWPIFGGTDPYTPAGDIEALRAAWADRPDCEIVVYPDADHGFVHAPERPAHRPDDAADAWRRALAFLLPD